MIRTKMTQCRSCGAEIAKNAKSCPKCGSNNRPIYLRWWFIPLALIVLFFAARTVSSINRNLREQAYTDAGYGIMVLDDGTTITTKELNKLADESRVSAEAKYLGQEVSVKMTVSMIGNWDIRDTVGMIRFSYSDYTLDPYDYDILTNLHEDDIIQVTGTIDAIGGGNWYTQLKHITSIKKFEGDS